MTVDSKYIRTGFFKNFKGDDSILISVDIYGLLEMENGFLQLSQGLTRFDFLTLKYLDTKYHANIKAYNDKDNLGLKQLNKGKIEWRLSKDKWGHEKKLSPLPRTRQPKFRIQQKLVNKFTKFS